MEQESLVKLQKPKGADTFLMDGYVPDSFSEVSNVCIYVNDSLVFEQDIGVDRGLFIQQPVPREGKDTTVQVKIVFNAKHIPQSGDADQRCMSALISKIGFQ